MFPDFLVTLCILQHFQWFSGWRMVTGGRDGYDKGSETRLHEFQFYPYFLEALYQPGNIT